jgi:hypothetical protein
VRPSAFWCSAHTQVRVVARQKDRAFPSRSVEEINASLYPNLEPKENEKSRRITENKIEHFIRANGVAKTAEILGVSQGRVSQLRGERQLRQWVIAAGKREKLLAAIEKTGVTNSG